MYYPLVMTNSLLLKMVIEIVDFPTQNGGSFHSYVNVYQRVLPLGVKKNTERTSFGPSERQLIGIKEIS